MEGEWVIGRMKEDRVSCLIRCEGWDIIMG